MPHRIAALAAVKPIRRDFSWSSCLRKTAQWSVPPSFPNQFEGHPGFLHGGIIATLLDETMSKAVRARGLTAMTRHMEVDYKRPVPSLRADSHGGTDRQRRGAQTLGRSYNLRRRWTCARAAARGCSSKCARRSPLESVDGAVLYFSVESQSMIVLSRKIR